MKKTLLITGVLLALTATVASAAGLNFYWNDCSVGGATNKTFACTTNSGGAEMVISFDPPFETNNQTGGLGSLVGTGQVIDLQSNSSPLPQWWMFKNAGFCRANAMSTALIPLSKVNCANPWSQQESPTFDLYQTNFGGNPARARILCSTSVGGANAADVAPGTEYYTQVMSMSFAKTVGTGLCAGCLDPVCLVLNDLQLNQISGSAGGSPHLTSPITSNFITWQGGAVGGGCPGATPTINRSWGAVKSLYR